jgi:hypothetical protein
VTDRAHDAIRTSEASVGDLTLRVCELQGLVDELQAQRDLRSQSERIHELEIASQRRELDVRFAFEATLEQRLLECQQQIESLHAHVDIEVQRRFAAQLSVEREHVLEAQRERDDVRRELDAERQRISYRTAQRVVIPVTKGRAFFAMLRRTARVIRDRLAPAR